MRQSPRGWGRCVVGGVVAYRLRANLRRWWRVGFGLALLVAVLGGVVLATAAGARRTSSAYGRLLDVVNPPELLVSPPGGGPGFDPSPFYDALAQVPGVRRIRVFAGIPLAPQAGTSSARLAEALSGGGVLADIGDGGADIGRPRMVSGRLPDPGQADEVMVSERFARTGDVDVGDHIDAVILTGAETDSVDLVATADQGTPIRLTVTGIGVLHEEVVPFDDLSASGTLRGTAELSAMVDRGELNFEGAMVDVEPGTDLVALTDAIEDLGQQLDLGTGGPVFVSDQAAAVRRTNDAMRPLAFALGVAAVAIGVVVLLVVGQAVSRASRETSDDVEALRAIGSRSSDRVAFLASRAAVDRRGRGGRRRGDRPGAFRPVPVRRGAGGRARTRPAHRPDRPRRRRWGDHRSDHPRARYRPPSSARIAGPSDPGPLASPAQLRRAACRRPRCRAFVSRRTAAAPVRCRCAAHSSP